jgi:hypothetical protein
MNKELQVKYWLAQMKIYLQREFLLKKTGSCMVFFSAILP